MTNLMEYALLVGGVCLAVNAITGLIGLPDPGRRVRNGVPALILAILALGGYALLLD